MNKKAAIILLSASIAFFIASAIFFSTQVKMPYVLGDSQMSVARLHEEGELYLAYLEDAAKLALAESMKIIPKDQKKDIYTLCSEKPESCDEISKHFKGIFKKHVESFNKAYDQHLSVDNYKFDLARRTIDGKPLIELVAVSTDEVKVKKGEDIEYTIKPSFRIQASLDELNQLSATSEVIAVLFFKEVVDKFKNCQKQDKKTTCICGDPEIDPNKLPEGYHIKVTTEAEREDLIRAANYKFELLHGNDVVPIGKIGWWLWKKDKVFESVPGRLGAFEFISADFNKSLCYPGAISKPRVYLIEKNSEKGKLFFFVEPANCQGISEFSMVAIVRESELKGLTTTKCEEIGVKL